ncbi:hypothetical protein Bca52824_053928 [Brassica carinata]|uniref:Uncharacterized protein n=1 Tax=Brassica carinata TaxID=52824 RepID=A0A8X7R9V4_BRACI|nr:hypothetical protein Bca52824_053928 [Brassica carinata]
MTKAMATLQTLKMVAPGPFYDIGIFEGCITLGDNGVSILKEAAEAEVVADAGLVVDLAVKSGMVVVQTGAQGVMGQGGNVVSDLLRELAAPIGSHLQVEKQTVQVEGVTSPRLTISDPITESFIDSEESDVSASRLSRLLEVDEDDDEVLEDAISEVEETEDGELIEDKATLPKQENGRGRRAAGANSHKSAKKTIYTNDEGDGDSPNLKDGGAPRDPSTISESLKAVSLSGDKLTISDPITESFIDSEESGLGLVSGKAHSSHTAQRTEQGSTSVPHRDGGLNIDVSPSRLSRLLEVDEDDDEVLEDAISEVEETEDGELIEDKATLPKQENGRGRRAAGANSHKSAKKTIVRAKDLKFGGKQGQLKRSSLGKL